MHKPRTDNSKYKVIFELAHDVWHGYGSETLWCDLVEGNLYKVKNIPFFVLGLSYGDVIITKSKGDNLIFEEIKSRSGHSTYRLMILEDNMDKENLLSSLNRLGCYYESAEKLLKFPIYSLDIPKEVDINKVYKLLEQGELMGLWEFEEAHYYSNTIN